MKDPDWDEWVARLLERAPDTRRYRQFYERVDRHFPGWATVLLDPRFRRWASTIDTADGACMLGRLYACWDDMLHGDRDFAVLLRLCVTGMNASSRKPTPLQRLLRRLPEQPLRRTIPLFLGKYELLALLGRGGNGEVYLTWSRETTAIYALKLIRRDHLGDGAARAAFRNEAETWISMGDHPNIAKAYFYEETDGHLAVTMAFVEGRDGTGPSLADKIAHDRISEAQAAQWFLNVANGLAFAYQAGIKAHRDIKPANILITRDGVAQVSDFGLALSKCIAASIVHVAGTPVYMAPEQFRPGQSAGIVSDLYSLGASLYEVLSGGRLPFMPRNSNVPMATFIAQLREMQVHSRPAPLDSPYWPLLARCLATRPEDRFHDIGEFSVALAEVAAARGHPVPAAPVQKTDLWTLRDQGNTFMRLGKYEEAIRVFDEFLAIMPDEGAGLNRACCLENVGRYQEAMKFYEHLMKRDDEAGLINGSNCLAHLKQPDRAMECAQRATALYPNSKSAWITLGNRFYAGNLWREAIAAYANAGRLSPQDPTPLYNAGLAALALNDSASALAFFTRFMDVAPPDDARCDYVLRAKNRLKGNQPGGS